MSHLKLKITTAPGRAAGATIIRLNGAIIGKVQSLKSLESGPRIVAWVFLQRVAGVPEYGLVDHFSSDAAAVRAIVERHRFLVKSGRIQAGAK